VTIRTLSADEGSEVAGKTGGELLRRFGKKKYYSKAMINSAAARQGIEPEWLFWLYALFGSKSTFNEAKRAANEACEYDAMRIQMVHQIRSSGTTANGSADWQDCLVSILALLSD
jgi:hypothetical protein